MIYFLFLRVEAPYAVGRKGVGSSLCVQHTCGVWASRGGGLAACIARRIHVRGTSGRCLFVTVHVQCLQAPFAQGGVASKTWIVFAREKV